MAVISGSGSFSGTSGNDRLIGDGQGKTRDQIFGLGGNDLIKGKAKGDGLFGGNGDDRLFGGGGKDVLDGGANDDELFGQGGSDSLIGGSGNDLLSGGGGSDTLDGGDGDDELFGGGKADTLIGSLGDDLLDGEKGTDVADYSDLGLAITLQAVGLVGKGTNSTGGTDTIKNIEHIIGAVGEANSIDGSTGTNPLTSFNVNLKNETLTVNGIPGDPTFSIENFVNVIGTSQDDTIKGDDNNNILEGGEGSDLFISSGGNDVIAGNLNSSPFVDDGADDTVRYQDVAITLKPTGEVVKDGVATDQLIRVETIEGDSNETNTIDASTAGAGASIDVDLGAESLSINTGVPVIGVLDRTVINFKDVIGTDGEDTIVDNDLDNELRGGRGSDTITASLGDDTVFGGRGGDRIIADIGVDELTGNEGADIFVLGAGNQASFDDDGAFDFAVITDFVSGTDKIQLANGIPNSYSIGNSGGSTTISIAPLSPNGNLDLIAIIDGGFDFNTDVIFG